MWFKLIRDFQEPVPNKSIGVLPSFNSILDSFRIFKCHHDLSLGYLSPFHSTAGMSVKFYHLLSLCAYELRKCAADNTQFFMPDAGVEPMKNVLFMMRFVFVKSPEMRWGMF